jgi:hypothetical protein
VQLDEVVVVDVEVEPEVEPEVEFEVDPDPCCTQVKLLLLNTNPAGHETQIFLLASKVYPDGHVIVVVVELLELTVKTQVNLLRS